MAKDKDDHGVAPSARDGEPDGEPESLEQARRRLRDERDEAAVGAKRGNAIDDQDTPHSGEDDDGQLFVYEQGRKVSLGSLIPRGIPVEHAFVFGSARRKGAGSLIGFEEDVLLVIRGKVAAVKPVAKRKDDESLERVTVETHIAPKVVVAADSDEAMSMLAMVFEQRGIKAA